INQSFNTNIIIPVVSYIADGLRNQFTLYLNNLVISNIPLLFQGNISQLEINPSNIIDSLAGNLLSSFNPDSVLLVLKQSANNFIDNINPNDIFEELRLQLISKTTEFASVIASELYDELSNLLQQNGFAQSLNLLAENSPLSFGDLNIRFGEDGIPTGLQFDPTNISLSSRFVDLAGTIKHHKNHSTLGDCWIGDILLHIKVPSPEKAFSIRGIYMHGKTESFPWWFVQVEPGTPSEPGLPITAEAKPLENPLNLGPVKLVGACGRLGKNIEDVPGSGISPNNNHPFTALMHLIFFDKAGNGRNIRIETLAQLQTSSSGDYSFSFDGNLQAKSPNPQILEADPNALAHGELNLSYNSAEDHFLGTASAIIESPALCASGSLYMSLSPSHYEIKIGTPENRIIFVPGCTGWSPTGWLSINPSIIELGIGISFSAMAQSPQPIGISGFSITPFAGFSFAAGIMAAIQYSPSIALLNAGIWAEAWAGIGAHWQKNGDSGTWTLAEANISGSAIVKFSPKPVNIAGNLSGNVRVLCINLPFNLNFQTNI
ncbi:MAG: hypothetical protein JXR58_02955, partial [Bacteroidales bacterium]|nr:hypothetical protein [Bacteroidales bacterium]